MSAQHSLVDTASANQGKGHAAPHKTAACMYVSSLASNRSHRDRRVKGIYCDAPPRVIRQGTTMVHYVFSLTTGEVGVKLK